MATKSVIAFGLDFDNRVIRAVKISRTANGKKQSISISKTEELTGDFHTDSALKQGLKTIKDKMGINQMSRVATLVSGKQVFTAQVPFRKLPPEELAAALKLEIRKELPFDIGNATMDYQILDGGEPAEHHILVTAVTNVLISRHLLTLSSVGIKPVVVETLPTIIANAFFAGADEITDRRAYPTLHMGPNVCTLVIDGLNVPFFSRITYFTASELFPDNGQSSMPDRERQRRMIALGDEIVRSLSFYEKTYMSELANELFLTGDYVDKEELVNSISATTGLTVNVLDVCTKLDGNMKKSPAPGTFNSAVALAIRA